MDTSPVLTAGSHVTGALLYSFAYDAKGVIGQNVCPVV